MYIMRIDETTAPGRSKNRLLAVSCFAPLVFSLILVATVPLPVLSGTIGVGGAFGLTITVCVVTVVLLMARAQWKQRG